MKFWVLPLGLLLAGCLSTAASIVTAPIKVVGAGIDVAVDSVTTTQREADEDRGRAIRKQEEADRKSAKAAEKAERKAARERLKQDMEMAPY